MNQQDDLKQVKEEEKSSSKDRYFYFEVRNKNHIKDIDKYQQSGMGKKENRDYRKTKVVLEEYPEYETFNIEGKEKKIPLIARFFQDHSIQSDTAEGYWKIFYVRDESKIWSKIDNQGKYCGPIMKKYVENESIIPTEPPFRMNNPCWNEKLGIWKESI